MEMMESSEIEGVLSVLGMMKTGAGGRRGDVHSNGTLKTQSLMGLVRLARAVMGSQTREILREQLELSHGHRTVRRARRRRGSSPGVAADADPHGS